MFEPNDMLECDSVAIFTPKAFASMTGKWKKVCDEIQERYISALPLPEELCRQVYTFLTGPFQ